jgi:hypothetical protein
MLMHKDAADTPWAEVGCYQGHLVADGLEGPFQEGDTAEASMPCGVCKSTVPDGLHGAKAQECGRCRRGACWFHAVFRVGPVGTGNDRVRGDRVPPGR